MKRPRHIAQEGGGVRADADPKDTWLYTDISSVSRCGAAVLRVTMNDHYRRPGRVYYMRARTPLDCSIWINALQQAIRQFFRLGPWQLRAAQAIAPPSGVATRTY